MAQTTAPPNTKRVKVYELKNNDWYDRGTGFCSGIMQTGEHPEAHIVVFSEEDSDMPLLKTRITKDDGYQKQQETLIVWTEHTGVDMALSFQEAEGCAIIWDFVQEVQARIAAYAPDELSDDLLDTGPFVLPDPQLGRLDEIENIIRSASSTQPGREALTKFILSPEHMYINKLTPLVEEAEQLHTLGDLHKLCLIMKHFILLNDSSIIEFIVTDQAIMGVVGALEYDPDFPSHRANHRQYLSDSSKYKEVVAIDNPEVRRKIHATYRLLYLKDVVLARFLDDPTFSVVNSLIFYYQVDIVNFLQSSQDFLSELFGIITSTSATDIAEAARKKSTVMFIQNCCAISKSVQAQSRSALYHNFIQHGLFNIIIFALRHRDPALRVAGTDILVALIDHDPHMVRNHIFTAIKDRKVPLTDTLIELLLIEVDLGVKSQMADAIKILLDPSASQPPIEMHRGEVKPQMHPQTEAFIASFYEDSAQKLFEPLKLLEDRESMIMNVQEISLYTHLVEVLSFFLRSHSYKSKLFILNEGLHARVAQLLRCPQKYMRLTALKWFRTCIGLRDEFHNRAITSQNLFEPILDIVYETMPRDNLLNSACLELFEFIAREKDTQLRAHLMQYRERFMEITYVDTFRNLVHKHEDPEPADESIATEPIRNGRFNGLRDDLDEEAYFDADDDDDDDIALPDTKRLVDYPDDDDEAIELLASSPDSHKRSDLTNGAVGSSPTNGNVLNGAAETNGERPSTLADTSVFDGAVERGRDRRPVPFEGSPSDRKPPREDSPSRVVSVEERKPYEVSRLISMDFPSKRRREDEEEEDELGKLMGGQVKRRSSSASMRSRMSSDDQPAYHLDLDIDGSPTPPDEAQPAPVLRRTKSVRSDLSGADGPKSVMSDSLTEHEAAKDSGGGG